MKRLPWAVAVATLLLIVVGGVASSAFPDGLEHVAELLGFASRSTTVGPPTPFANYESRYFRSRWVAQVSTGLLGVAILYGFGAVFGRALKRKRAPKPEQAHASRHSR